MLHRFAVLALVVVSLVKMHWLQLVLHQHPLPRQHLLLLHQQLRPRPLHPLLVQHHVLLLERVMKSLRCQRFVRPPAHTWWQAWVPAQQHSAWWKWTLQMSTPHVVA